jgi:hypothetical protein
MTNLENPVSTLAASGADAVLRGTVRMFHRYGIAVQAEVPLRNNRRADLMGIDAKGHVVIVEIKVAKADLLGDQKWGEYLDYCDRFYWAICPTIDAGLLEREAFLPQRTGLIIADQYDAEIIRPAATVTLAAARRKKETERLARLAMRRHSAALGWIGGVSDTWEGE